MKHANPGNYVRGIGKKSRKAKKKGSEQEQREQHPPAEELQRLVELGIDRAAGDPQPFGDFGAAEVFEPGQAEDFAAASGQCIGLGIEAFGEFILLFVEDAELIIHLAEADAPERILSIFVSNLTVTDEVSTGVQDAAVEQGAGNVSAARF